VSLVPAFGARPAQLHASTRGGLVYTRGCFLQAASPAVHTPLRRPPPRPRRGHHRLDVQCRPLRVRHPDPPAFAAHLPKKCHNRRRRCPRSLTPPRPLPTRPRRSCLCCVSEPSRLSWLQHRQHDPEILSSLPRFAPCPYANDTLIDAAPSRKNAGILTLQAAFG